MDAQWTQCSGDPYRADMTYGLEANYATQNHVLLTSYVWKYYYRHLERYMPVEIPFKTRVYVVLLTRNTLSTHRKRLGLCPGESSS